MQFKHQNTPKIRMASLFVYTLSLCYLLSSCSAPAQQVFVTPSPQPEQNMWVVQHQFITESVYTRDPEAALNFFVVKPADPFTIAPLEIVISFRRSDLNIIEVSFTDNQPYNSFNLAEVTPETDPSYPTFKQLFPADQAKQRREIWESLRISPSEIVTMTAPLAREAFLQPFHIQVFELIIDKQIEQVFHMPAAWLVMYNSGENSTLYWIDPRSGDILYKATGKTDQLGPENRLPKHTP